MKRSLTAAQFDTKAVRANQLITDVGAHSEPVFLNSGFVFDSAAQAAARFAGDEPGPTYGRLNNPTVEAFIARLAALEGGSHGIATSTGMAAITSVMMAFLKSGDHVVASAGLFGSTITLLNNIFTRFGVETSFVDLDDLASWQKAIRPNTRLLFLETPSNPLLTLGDIQAISTIAHETGALCVVDNAFCTPALQQPLKLGADIVVHSATKYLDGQGRVMGGAVVVKDEALYDELFLVLRTAGVGLSPFNAWVLNQSLETLPLRMRAHSENAGKVARWLDAQHVVTRVHYPGLAHHPQHGLAATQQTHAGGMVSFEVKGGREAAWAVIDACQMISISVNLGDAKSIITHPASTSHARISEAERQHAGVTQNLLRLSVGLENVDDIIADLQL